EQRAWDFVDTRKNTQVLIRHKPNRPEVSVLRQLDQQWPAEIPFDVWERIPIWARRGKRNWPTAQAVVESVSRRRLDNDEIGEWANELVFSYSVKGTYYLGIFRYSLKDEEMLEGWKGKSILIHYLPENPSKSVMFLDEQHQMEGLQVS